MMKTMRMKKLCALALVCLCAIFAAPALAAHPKGAFGPEIMGLQLGMTITPAKMLELACVLFKGRDFEIEVGYWDGDLLLFGGKHTLSFSLDGNQLKNWDIDKPKEGQPKKIGRQEETLKEKYSRYKTFSEVFDALREEHIKNHPMGTGMTAELFLSPRGYGRNWKMMRVRNWRLASFILPSFVFLDARNMSLEDFAQTIYDAYPLPDLYESGNSYYGREVKEGWAVGVRVVREEQNVNEEYKGFKYSVRLEVE